MKKFFTLICALVGMTASVNAATIDDVAVCKHSYVLVADEYTNNGKSGVAKNSLIGDGFFLAAGTDGTMSVNTGKGNFDLSDASVVGEDVAAKYGDLGSHLNSLRLKTTQGVLAMKINAGSKLIIYYDNATRWPRIAKAADMKELLSKDDVSVVEKLVVGGKDRARFEWVADDDRTIYIGSSGDIFFSYIIVEANEAPGTPSVKVSDQKYEDGLWFREVTCKANSAEVDGEMYSSIVTYTTDGTTPTASSTVYTAPIKCYNNMTVKFQAFMDFGTPTPEEGTEFPGADNEAIVSFSFNAPKLVCEAGVVTVSTEYEGAKNMISVDGAEYAEGNSITLTESAIVTAKSVIVNGTYATFETKTTSIDALVLTPITEEVTVTVSGEAVKDEEASATSTTGPVYKIENGVINADKMQFFNKGMEFKAIANVDEKNAKYQVPDGQEAYMMFGNDSRLYFELGSAADVEVICSKNSCKTLNEDDDETVTTDRKCFVNVSGKTYGFDNCEYDEDGKTVKSWTPAAEIKTTINFELEAGQYYFAKYSGTGNILLSSIKISPKDPTGIKNVTTVSAAKVVKAIENGQLVIKSAKGTFNVAGAQMK